jgi:hypothetical protein
MKDMWVLLIMWGTTALWVPMFGRIMWTALRTGRWLARGRIYDRINNPRTYWFAIISVTAMFSFFLFCSLLATEGFIRAIQRGN